MRRLKILLRKEFGLRYSHLTLQLGEGLEPLQDNQLLADCRVSSGSTVTVMLAGGLPGGADYEHLQANVRVLRLGKVLAAGLPGGMGCGPSTPSAAEHAADEIEARERARLESTIGVAYENPLRSKKRAAKASAGAGAGAGAGATTATNPAFRNAPAPVVILTDDALKSAEKATRAANAKVKRLKAKLAEVECVAAAASTAAAAEIKQLKMRLVEVHSGGGVPAAGDADNAPPATTGIAGQQCTYAANGGCRGKQTPTLGPYCKIHSCSCGAAKQSRAKQCPSCLAGGAKAQQAASAVAETAGFEFEAGGQPAEGFGQLQEKLKATKKELAAVQKENARIPGMAREIAKLKKDNATLKKSAASEGRAADATLGRGGGEGGGGGDDDSHHANAVLHPEIEAFTTLANAAGPAAILAEGKKSGVQAALVANPTDKTARTKMVTFTAKLGAALKLEVNARLSDAGTAKTTILQCLAVIRLGNNMFSNIYAAVWGGIASAESTLIVKYNSAMGTLQAVSGTTAVQQTNNVVQLMVDALGAKPEFDASIAELVKRCEAKGVIGLQVLIPTGPKDVSRVGEKVVLRPGKASGDASNVTDVDRGTLHSTASMSGSPSLGDIAVIVSKPGGILTVRSDAVLYL